MTEMIKQGMLNKNKDTVLLVHIPPDACPITTNIAVIKKCACTVLLKSLMCQGDIVP